MCSLRLLLLLYEGRCPPLQDLDIVVPEVVVRFNSHLQGLDDVLEAPVWDGGLASPRHLDSLGLLDEFFCGPGLLDDNLDLPLRVTPVLPLFPLCDLGYVSSFGENLVSDVHVLLDGARRGGARSVACYLESYLWLSFGNVGVVCSLRLLLLLYE